MIDILIMGGTWNPNGDPVTETFANALDRRRFRHQYVPYPAAYGTPMSYRSSVGFGKHALVQAIRDSPNPVIVAGYSQGAAVAAEVAADIELYPDLDVRAAALIACPSRPRGLCVGTDPGGYGVVGELAITKMLALHAAAFRDPICALPEGSMLRYLADMSAYMSISSPQEFAQWGASIVDLAVRRRFQRWWEPRNWRDTAEVISQANAYLTEGRHTTAYIDEGLCIELADAVNSL
ncbi:alpha/beta fold hydrolase [Nocardia fluminea]|uniref:alpha/beta fold hydrolase n=1 Tax=Nocardia fluminea TaxID=134984 RepID=UPI00365E72B3